jgi:hypothetical protein
MVAYILNIVDMLFTMYVISDGGIELNPIVNTILEYDGVLFAFLKIVVAGVLLLWLERKAKLYKVARQGLFAITIFYAILVLWHIVNFIIIRAIILW